jgi:hypothetical protein
MKRLERHQAVQARVFGQPDAAHTTVAKMAPYHVWADRRSNLHR